MRKDKVDLRTYRQVFPFAVNVDESTTTIEFRERWEKRVVLTMTDWQVAYLVKQLAKLPQKRAEALKRLRDDFAKASADAAEARP